MTTAALRVPRYPDVPSQLWRDIVKMGDPGGVSAGGTANPAATYNGTTYIAYVDPAGNARVASYKHTSGVVAISPPIVTGLFDNWHATPAILVRSSDHKIVIAVPAVSHFYVAISTNAEDVSAWGAASDIAATLGSADPYVFASLFQLSGESAKIYLVYATEGSTHYLCFSTSTDGGSTWAAQTQLFSTGTTAFSICGVSNSDGTNRIDFLVSDGQAGTDASASLYHFYYTGGSYYKSDGILISHAFPLPPSSLTKVFDGATNGLVRAPNCIITNGGSPVATWAAFNSGGSGFNENYWYGIFNGGSWTVNKIADSGSLEEIPGTAEGCVCPDILSPDIVYVSKKVSGVWQMFKYETPDSGATWTSTQLTTDASQGGLDGNVKPYPPVNAVAALRVIWLCGVYGPQSIGASVNINVAMKIRGYPNPIGPS